MLQYLTAQTSHQNFRFDQWAVGNSLYGLQSLPDSAESRALVAALVPKVAA